ncbi:protein of unknown function [Paenibacillus sp. UNCCL117]|uniref:DUF4132 domain-containing protein n=1 Tax=unclassified Paenibacillus TaxID=185978 RepID=UPI00088A17C2|nr:MULTISPECIES: DUF4132 domain-containing protein [unclassified Paenibacillus]SDE48922.1 protein of unknown function [Paenibacillus sp. cl123]SFW66772.1 protein of unknown function [Paenibacillus sp. UNCCL117]
MLITQPNDEATNRLEQLILENLDKEYQERQLIHSEIGGLLDQIYAQDKKEAYFAPFIPITEQVAGEYSAEIMRYLTSHITEYPYAVGYIRRPFRTNNSRVHTQHMIRKLFALYDLSKTSFSLMEYLTTPVDLSDRSIVSYMIAFELDRNNCQVFDALKEILFGDNNTALLSKAMIRGMFLSHQAEAHQMLGQMLVAARLQEGLRQSIVETMDEGTIEAFTALLKVIIDHDFIRYSSVIRSLDVWTGLGLEAANSRVAKQCIAYAYECLNDEKVCLEWAGSQDVHKLYFSLWATAVREEERLPSLIRGIMEQGAVYQQIAAQYFLTQSQNNTLRFSLSVSYLAQSTMELQSLVIANYVYRWSTAWRGYLEDEGLPHKPVIERIPMLERKEERGRQFELFKTMLLQLPKLEIAETSRVFDWMTYSHSTDAIAHKMLYLAAYDLDPDYIAQIIELKDRVTPDLRRALIQTFTSDVANPVQRQFIFDSLSDKSVSNREMALARIERMTLAPRDVEKVQNLLKLKTGALRQNVIKILLKQDHEQLEQTMEVLLKSTFELQRLGALEMLCELKEDREQVNHFEQMKHHMASIKEPSDKERLLMERLQQQQTKGLHNGFDLFNPHKAKKLHKLPDYPDVLVKDLLGMPFVKLKGFLQRLSELIHAHRDYEYTAERFTGYKESYLLGARLERLKGYRKQDDETTHLEGYPLAEVWEHYLHESGITPQELSQIAFYFFADSFYKYETNKLTHWEAQQYKPLGTWGKTFLSEQYPMEAIRAFYEWLPELPYLQQVQQIVLVYVDDSDMPERFATFSQILNKVMDALQKLELEENSQAWSILAAPWIYWLDSTVHDDQSFLEYFAMKLNLDKLTYYEEMNPGLEEFVRARELGLIDDDDLYRELMTRRRSGRHIGTLTGKKEDFLKQYPIMKRFKANVLSVILELELNRGDLPTDVSSLATSIRYYEGMEYFIAILAGLDQESFTRGYIYANRTKKETLSHLLRVCHPKEGDDAQKLGEMLKGKRISEKRLLEAAMYAPQWLEIISEYLQWNGLRSAAWYFHAHVNEHFSAEKETIVAHYSPISPADFNDGAFDVHWFKDSYKELGEKRFNVLYQCAKYISAGANHRRSQLFADAVLGKLDLSEIRASVETKRNKDHLLSYSLIPLGEDRARDVLERYECIQQFLKESKKFGAQRSASEAKAAAIALDNLSRNAGYQDVIRLKWDMEARKLDEILPQLGSMAIEGIEVKITIDETGRADIEAAKQGKILKSLPSKLNKHPYVLSLKETVASLRDQYKRARSEFEKCMESESAFTDLELNNLMKNPTIAPILRTLVFQAGSRLGFFEDGRLVSATGESHPLSSEDVILIAHPLHLYRSGEWSLYQRVLFDREQKQPFKQVFRELYLPNQDELESGSISRRYAGHQIQPKRAVALLKARHWTVSYEEGLQKVYHKENIIAQVYALADWFSPSDIEAPTLETVSFIDRKSYKPLELSLIPGIIFSEIMRDVDLVVSTAHVGGVDPEASLTTIELRKVIITESLRLMKISNVQLEGNFARIAGSLGEYGVHLGSGTVQKHAAGTLYILPVHSQHRGKLFLPFMDEDPKTSEILSKIVMLAQDTKIKDPHILEQLKE